jgi:hypothetical protein
MFLVLLALTSFFYGFLEEKSPNILRNKCIRILLKSKANLSRRRKEHQMDLELVLHFNRRKGNSFFPWILSLSYCKNRMIIGLDLNQRDDSGLNSNIR